MPFVVTIRPIYHCLSVCQMSVLISVCSSVYYFSILNAVSLSPVSDRYPVQGDRRGQPFRWTIKTETYFHSKWHKVDSSLLKGLCAEQRPNFHSPSQQWLRLVWFFVCLGFIVPVENFSLIWRRHHYRWRAAKFDLCSALVAIEQWET